MIQVGRVSSIVIAKVEFNSIHSKGVFLRYSQLRKSHVFVLMHVFKGVEPLLIALTSICVILVSILMADLIFNLFEILFLLISLTLKNCQAINIFEFGRISALSLRKSFDVLLQIDYRDALLVPNVFEVYHFLILIIFGPKNTIPEVNHTPMEVRTRCRW